MKELKKKKILIFLGLSLIFLGCPNGDGKTVDVEPRLTLIGPQEVFFNVNDSYIEYGYTATDADGTDISYLVRRDASQLNMGKEGTYKIGYTAVDLRGVKSATLYRTVNVGSAFAPEITVSSENPLLLPLGSEFEVPGATAFSYDGKDLSEEILVDSSSVRTNQVGTYTVFYEVTDSTGAVGRFELSVYIMESSQPRMVIPGNIGISKENPYLLQLMGTSGEIDDEKKKAYLNNSLPNIQAFDLEDGDISYRVKIKEEGDFSSILDALNGAGSEDIFELVIAVSDFNENETKLSFFVKLVTDTTPPVITIPQSEITMVVDVWEDQTSEWHTQFNGLGIKVYDNSWDNEEPVDFNQTSAGVFPAGKQDLAVICTIDESNLLATQSLDGKLPVKEGYTADKIPTDSNAIDVETFKSTHYDYDNPNSEVNVKRVVLTAYEKKNPDNKTTAILNVKLVDKKGEDTPPKIWDRGTISVPYGLSSITDDYRPRWYDNTGATGPATGLSSLSEIGDARIEGDFPIAFRATFNGATSQPKNFTLRVGNPLKTSNPGKDYMAHNVLKKASFDGEQFSGYDRLCNGEKNQSYTPIVPRNWQLSTSSGNNYWRWKGLFSENNSNVSAIAEVDKQQFIYGGVKYSNKVAYMNSGCRQVETTTWQRGQNIYLTNNGENVTLFKDVTYRFGFHRANFRLSGSSPSSSERSVTFKTTGAGSIDGVVDFKMHFNSDDKAADLSGIYKESNWGNPSYQLLEKADTTYKDNWVYKPEDKIITGDDVTNITLYYSILTGEEDDFGTLCTDIHVFPLKWKAKQNGTGNVGINTYDPGSGTITWSAN